MNKTGKIILTILGIGAVATTVYFAPEISEFVKVKFDGWKNGKNKNSKYDLESNVPVLIEPEANDLSLNN